MPRQRKPSRSNQPNVSQNNQQNGQILNAGGQEICLAGPVVGVVAVQRLNGRSGGGQAPRPGLSQRTVRHNIANAHEYETHLRHLHSNQQRRATLTHKFMTVSAMAFTGGALSLIALLTYNGYLQTRVNTPIDKEKVVGASGLSVSDRYWGAYRSGAYFGMKTRDPHSPVMGLMWYFESHISTGFAGIRHLCEQNENLLYGWKEHDGRNFGVQDIVDHNYNITTSFVKRPGGRRGGEWTAFVNVSAKFPEANGHGVSLMFYTALDDKTPGRVSSSEGNLGFDGYTDELGNFSVKLQPRFGEVYQTSYLTTRLPALDKIKEVTEHSLRVVRDPSGQKRIIILPGYKVFGTKDNPNPVPNFSVQKIDGKIPFGLEIVYKSGPSSVLELNIPQSAYEKDLDMKRESFHKKFDSVFKLKEKGYNSKMQEFAKAAFSNLIGGISYFYGSSLVQSKNNPTPVPYWKAPLYTAVPSRSFFPRGFLWDEGFHDLLLMAWDREITLDIMSHWFDLMNIQGWIPREQILGAEALAKVPQEFVVQHNENANPPTFFLTLQNLLRNHKEELIMNPAYLDTLERMYPRLQTWFAWFNTTQVGPHPTTYRWRGRDANVIKFLNPKTLTSGLDDYPRASHPTSEERHVDLRCWMALGAEVLAEIADILGRDGGRYRSTYHTLKDNALLDQLHWSGDRARYADYGLHTDAVILSHPTTPRHDKHDNEMIRVVLAEPEYRFVDKQFGYINLFPFFLQILDPTSEHLEKVLNDIRNPSLLWTQHGLRSLSPNSPLYMKRNTEHDPPYWRGQIWININYLACRALHHYANIIGPHQQLASEIYDRLRNNIVKSLHKEYERTGFLWENYEDKNGEGKGCHPFNGWSALVTLIMAEIY